jgi:hypothetical protein
MFVTFEVSRPFKIIPGFYRCAGLTSFRVWWLWFAVSLHPVRMDELVGAVADGEAAWGGEQA